MIGVSGSHFECDGEDGADQQDLEHKVVKCGPKERAEFLGLERLAEVVSKESSSLIEVAGVEASLDIHLQFLTETFQA